MNTEEALQNDRDATWYPDQGDIALLTMALTRDVECDDLRTPTCGVRTFESTMAQTRDF